jgi:beta-xylosidase
MTFTPFSAIAKKEVVVLLGLMVLTTISFAQTTENLVFAYFKGNGEDGLHLAYSHDGYRWKALLQDSSFLKPSIGQEKLMRDPNILQGPDGIFHMVWTCGWNERGIGYATSRDLIHWSPQQFIPVMESEKDARNCWAPELFYDRQKNQFMIYWATTVTGLFPESQSKKENGYNHRIYYTTTRDFKNFSPPEVLYDLGFNVIDATIVEYDKKYVMFLKDETADPPQKNIRLSTSDQLTGGYSASSPPFSGSSWAEGPTAIKVGEYWFVYYDLYMEKSMGASRSKDLKVWNDVSPRLSFPQGARHGSVFKVDKLVLDKLLLQAQ